MPEGFGSVAKVSKKSNIIQNLSNSLSHRVGAYKRDEVHMYQTVYSMATSTNTLNGRVVAKVLGMDR
jgi:hypothetical protein